MPPRTPGALLPSVDNEEHAGVSAIRPNDSVDVRQETGCPTHRRRGGSSSSTRFPSRGAKFNDSICELTARQSMRALSWPRRTSPTAQRSAQPALGSSPGSQGCRRGKTVLRAPWRRQQVAPRRERSASPRHRASDEQPVRADPAAISVVTQPGPVDQARRVVLDQRPALPRRRARQGSPVLETARPHPPQRRRVRGRRHRQRRPARGAIRRRRRPARPRRRPPLPQVLTDPAVVRVRQCCQGTTVTGQRAVAHQAGRQRPDKPGARRLGCADDDQLGGPVRRSGSVR